MFESLLIAFYTDLLVFVLCTFTLFKYGKLSILHPATTYLIFHLFVFTSRLGLLILGAKVFLSEQTSYFSEIQNHELVKAVLLADVGFIAMTIAWVLEMNREVNKNRVDSPILLDSSVVRNVLFFTIPLGIWGIFSQLYIPFLGKNQADFGAWQDSSYLVNTQNWLLLSLLIIVFMKGFQKYSVGFIGLCLFILAFQGQHRYRILIPCVFLLMLYLYRQQKKWIPLKIVFLILFGVVVFLPMKYIGKLVQQGATITELIAFSSEYGESLALGANADFSFLDMYASTLTLIEQSSGYYYGSTYLTLFLAPIPRQFWENKPSLMQWMTDISTTNRNLRELGAVATLYGESYANFGYLGIVFIPFLLAKYSTRWYKNVTHTHPQSANLFLYLYFTAISVQIYRDGLNAIFMFLWVYNMPGFAVYIFSILKQKRA